MAARTAVSWGRTVARMTRPDSSGVMRRLASVAMSPGGGGSASVRSSRLEGR
jgi:hypothetical protein